MYVDMVLKSVSPLLMHNPRLADPLDPITKQLKLLTGKRKKTEEDLAAIEKLEWTGGLYVEEGVGLSLPTSMIRACLYNGGTATKQGALVERAVVFTDIHVPFEYKGPRDMDQLYDAPEHRYRTSVVIQQKRMMRVRPAFPKWGLSARAHLVSEIMDLEDLQRIAEVAGRLYGLGDNRANGFGRFDITITESEES